MNARGHAPSNDIDPAKATFDTFADDVIALADQLELARFVVGGISLGAATALNLAIRYPRRVTALVLCRPAWLDRPQAEFQPEPLDLHCQRPQEQVGERVGPREPGHQRRVQLLDDATSGRSGPLPPASCPDPANPCADCRSTDRPDRGTGSARLSGLRC
jgi:pimeloyl-ACP methyl ester carboxylesterase